jgi:D-alanine transaminase
LESDKNTMSNVFELPCYLNGHFSPIADAKVSVLDRGFIFGDGVYEVVPAYKGRPFRLQQHLARMNRSLAAIRLPNPLSEAAWVTLVSELLMRYAQHMHTSVAESDQLVYIQITRGVAPRDHVMPSHPVPTVFAMSNQLKPASATDRALGVACTSAVDFRWQKAHIKSTSLLGSVLARQISADAGTVETIMFRDGFLSEAAASNVWVVRDGVLRGPPKDNLVLQGIRYDLLAELCASAGIAYQLGPITEAEVRAADEVLLSSATKEVLPVCQLDGHPIGTGAPGPVYHALYTAYQKAKTGSH